MEDFVLLKKEEIKRRNKMGFFIVISYFVIYITTIFLTDISYLTYLIIPAFVQFICMKQLSESAKKSLDD